MKKICLSICLCLSVLVGKAQVEARYDKGNVPVVNGRVLFQDTVATTLDKAANYELVSQWAKQRFNKPNVIISKMITDDANNQNLSFTAEEWIVFTNRFFVLDRTRINYWVEISCTDGGVAIKMTRINYWYEEEREGGLKFSAEEFITDEEAFNKKGTKLLKDQGKFRRGTIDFFDRCVNEMAEALTL